MAELTHPQDIVVFIPGIMGSSLAQHGRPVWDPSAGAVLNAIRTLGRSIGDLTLTDWVAEDAPAPGDTGGGVTPMRVLPDVHVIPGLWTANIGYQKVIDWLKVTFGLRTDTGTGSAGNLIEFAYDWRLSSRYNARVLKTRVESLVERRRALGGQHADTRVIFVCHSMGGLVARTYIDLYGGRELTRKLVTWGTPHRGAFNAVDTLVNGLQVGVGPFKVGIGPLTRFVRCLPSMYELLPEYACIDAGQPALLKTVDAGLPNLQSARVQFGMDFHTAIDDAADWRDETLDFYPLIGMRQQTSTTGRLAMSKVEGLPTIGGEDRGGDGTVPRLSAAPKGFKESNPSIRDVTDKHGAIQSNAITLDSLLAILTAKDIVYMGPEAATKIDVRTPETAVAGQPIDILAVTREGERQGLTAAWLDEHMQQVGPARPLQPGDEGHRGTVIAPTEGLYAVRVTGSGAAASRVTPVTSLVTVWDGAL